MGENQALFQTIIQNNSDLFQIVYTKAEVLFNRLAGVNGQFNDWIAFGCVDMDQLADEHLKEVTDWELNIKMVKLKGKEAEKLPL